MPIACKALGGGKLYTWEYGNEPDLFSTSSQGPVRPAAWNETTYVWQWLNGTQEIKKQISKYCPELAANGEPEFMAPSFAGSFNHLKSNVTWADGLNKNKDITLFSTHK